MTRKQPGLRRQRQQLAADRLDQHLEITPGQVGTPDRAREDYVTNEGKIVGRRIQYDVAWGVPGSMAHFKHTLAEANAPTGRQLVCRRRNVDCREPERGCLVRHSVVEGPILRMQVDRDLRKRPPDCGDPFDVIQVRVSEKNRARPRAGPAKVTHHAGCRRSRVHYQGLAVILTDGQISVLNEGAARKGVNLHASGQPA